MIRSILIGAVAGARSLAPPAALALTAERAPRPLRYGLPVLALGEVLGDKWPLAPDRVSPAGLMARVVTGGLSAAALAPRGRRAAAAALGAGAAVLVAELSFRGRMAAMRSAGQGLTGWLEDALALSAALWLAEDARRRHT